MFALLPEGIGQLDHLGPPPRFANIKLLDPAVASRERRADRLQLCIIVRELFTHNLCVAGHVGAIYLDILRGAFLQQLQQAIHERIRSEQLLYQAKRCLRCLEASNGTPVTKPEERCSEVFDMKIILVVLSQVVTQRFVFGLEALCYLFQWRKRV